MTHTYFPILVRTMTHTYFPILVRTMKYTYFPILVRTMKYTYFPILVRTMKYTYFPILVRTMTQTHALSHLVIVLTGHDVGEGDLGLEHLPAVHELHQQVAHRLKLHPFGGLYIREYQSREYLSQHEDMRGGREIEMWLMDSVSGFQKRIKSGQSGHIKGF